MHAAALTCSSVYLRSLTPVFADGSRAAGVAAAAAGLPEACCSPAASLAAREVRSFADSAAPSCPAVLAPAACTELVGAAPRALADSACFAPIAAIQLKSPAISGLAATPPHLTLRRKRSQLPTRALGSQTKRASRSPRDLRADSWNLDACKPPDAAASSSIEHAARRPAGSTTRCIDPTGLTLPIAGVRSWVEWGGVIKVDF